uniref:Platelet-derived growth factor (PDGF) family profile domain-containing protein n=1 Tax=Lygus hesperus TaxID=30085 RepID=A0A0A9Z801_LYGHE
MRPTWCALFFLVSGVAGRHKLVTTTELNASDETLGTESTPTTYGYARKHEEPFDDYDDPEDEDYQFYEDESEVDELEEYEHQADTSDDTVKNVDNNFWSRPSGTFRLKPHYNEDPVATEEVKRHRAKAASETKCRFPAPRVVRVLEQHPSATKQYIPSCTVIHQCSENTGCCSSSRRCGPKRIEKVELPFYAVQISAGMGGHHTRKTYKTEKLVFFNHTECECLQRTDDMPRDVLPTPDPPAGPKCQCPSPFNVRILSGGACSCDCFDREKDCIKYKKGKDYLNHKDRLCIEMRKCLVPTCDFGLYVRRSGRCPRIGEKHRF